LAVFYLGEAEFYKGWQHFTWGEQNFTKGGGILPWGEQGFYKEWRIFTLERAWFYKGWRIFIWGEQKGGVLRMFTWRAQSFCLREQILGMESEILIRFERQSPYSFLYCIIINY
jgi:hypothetical protein